MPLAHSKLTSQGQISVPAEIRKRLALAPGSVLAWDEKGGEIVVSRAGRYTSAEVHAAVFPDGPPATGADAKAGIAEYVRRRHARR
jgi:AbrB family looped-hinge helix DNA binding protein